MNRSERAEGTAYDPSDGPTNTELAAIEAEWPLIEAELELLDAQIAALSARGEATRLVWRRVRRAERRVLTVRRVLAADLQRSPARKEAA